MRKQASEPDEVGVFLPLTDRLHIRLFGGVDLQRGGIPLRRTRSRTEIWLLAALLLRSNRNVERSWLAGIFWSESSEAQALNNLRRSLSNLRHVLGEESYRLVSPTQHTIAFDLADAFCDVVAFDSALAHKDTASLRRAVELYRGPLLPGCDADWLLPERNAREQAYLSVLETLADEAVQNGEGPEAVRLLRQALQIDPYRETTHRTLLKSLALLGDKVAMTQAYRQLRLRLNEELRTEPSAETKDLYQLLQEHVPKLGTTAFIPPEGSAARLVSLIPPLRIPSPVSDLVGREEEIAEVEFLLRNNRLVTLTGSGGIGKTRLALAVLTKIALDFPEGVWFVDLASVTDPAQVLPTVSRALEVQESKDYRSPADALREHLQGRRLVLLVDNAEHLLESCATLIATLLEALPELRVLVTSRQALGAAGEQIWRVPSLSFPESATDYSDSRIDLLMGYAGPRLFVTRALSASSVFVLTERNAPAVRQICKRLDGIPLALELAAARVASLSVEQIAARLEDAFHLLTTGARTALPRQQTLRALVDWSYDLLPEPEKALLSRLSVFAGGWTIEVAESVCGFAPLKGSEVLDCLTSLVDKSLILAEETGGAMRYRMLETLRQYGMEKQNARGEALGVLQHRHINYFVELVEEATPKLHGAEQGIWLNCLEAEHDNLRTALRWCEAESGEADVDWQMLGVRLAGALGMFWEVRGHLTEGRGHMNRALSRARNNGVLGGGNTGQYPHTAIMARALHRAGSLALRQSDHVEARSLYAESLVIYRELGDNMGIAATLMNLGNTDWYHGDYTGARVLQEECLAIYREIGNKNGIATALLNLGSIADSQGDYSTARSLLKESLTLRREMGDTSGAASALMNLGNGANSQGDYAAARSLLEESFALFHELGDKRNAAYSLLNLGYVATHQGEYAEARSRFIECLAVFQEVGDKRSIAYSLEGFALILSHTASLQAAAMVEGASNALRESIKCPLPPSEQVEHNEHWERIRSALGTVAYSDEWEEGRALSMEQAIDYTLKNAEKLKLL